MAEQDQERTEAPTPRRLEEARQEGNVARSNDLTAACVLLAAILLLYAFGARMLRGMRTTLLRTLEQDAASHPARADDIGSLLSVSGQVMLKSAGPIVLGLFVVAMAVTIAQVGFLLTAKPLQPNFSRLSPIRGIRNLVDVRAAVRLVMSIAKVVIIAAVASIVIAHDLPGVVHLARMDTGPIYAAATGLVFALALKLALILVLLAVFEYAFQRMQRQRDLRMTKQDVKEEMKRMEGDPLIRQRRARVARQLTMQRVGHTVPGADVVVTNPTHYAVALKYDAETMKAPRVVAKGADFLAQRIRQIAIAHGVPIVERRELAQGIYRTVEVGQEVPPQYYGAVAEILAYVYRLSGRQSA
ncbi:MAG: flagellar biosynthesis protein FlhB [Phycisphaeraceae bacterium]|nr:flagellar biosynthesis protein FlhB [Phycisphaeraceae bacterium]